MKIVIANVFGHDNRGDAALVEVLVQEIRFAFGEKAEIIGIARNPAEQMKQLPEVTWRQSLARSTASSVAVRRVMNLVFLTGLMICAILRLPPWLVPLPRMQRAALRDIHSADLVVSCAGGFLHDANASIFTSLAQLFVAYAYRVPFVLAPQTIGPIRGKLARIASKHILSKAKMIYVREKITKKFLLWDLGLPESIVKEYPDLALFHSAVDHAGAVDSLKAMGLIPQKDFFAITALNWEFPGTASPKDAQSKYEEKLAFVAKELHSEFGLPVLLLNQVSSDLSATRRIRELAGSFVIVDDVDRSPAVMRGIIYRAKAMVASRFHSCIFALLEGTPVQAISYNYKTDGIMAMLGLSARVHNIENFDASVLLKALKEDISKGREMQSVAALLGEGNARFGALLPPFVGAR